MAMNINSKLNITTLSLRWTARAASLLSIGIILLFFVGFNPGSVRPGEWVGLAFFPAGVVIGMIVAWWKDGLAPASPWRAWRLSKEFMASSWGVTLTAWRS